MILTCFEITINNFKVTQNFPVKKRKFPEIFVNRRHYFCKFFSLDVWNAFYTQEIY